MRLSAGSRRIDGRRFGSEAPIRLHIEGSSPLQSAFSYKPPQWLWFMAEEGKTGHRNAQYEGASPAMWVPFFVEAERL